jgi:hydrogenase-4 component B
VALVPVIAGGALALTAALAVACFVKAFGITFLALPRSPEAASAREVGRLELVAMATLAAACVVLGLAAAPVVAAIGTLLRASLLAPPRAISPEAPLGAQLFVPGLAVAILALGALSFGLARLLGPISIRHGETWASGRALHANSQYSAVAFAKPIRLMFADIVRPVREIDIVHRTGSRFVASVHYRSHIAPVFERYVYRSITDALVVGSHVVRRAQNGSLQTYLAYTFVALLVGLVLAR